MWTSISGETYNKNVTSFLKENLLRFNIKKENLTYIILNRIDLFSKSENIYEKIPQMCLQLMTTLNIERSIKFGEDLSRDQEKKDFKFIHITNQAMINEFFILNHKREKLTRWLNT